MVVYGFLFLIHQTFCCGKLPKSGNDFVPWILLMKFVGDDFLQDGRPSRLPEFFFFWFARNFFFSKIFLLLVESCPTPSPLVEQASKDAVLGDPYKMRAKSNLTDENNNILGNQTQQRVCFLIVFIDNYLSLFS